MKKITKLKICNWSLLLLTLAILISGIQLEATGSRGFLSVWIHMGIGIFFFMFVAYHFFLHFGKSNWFSKFHKLKTQFTRVLWWVSLIALITGVVAAIHWISTTGHSPIGGVHGKIGFLMIILAVCHIYKRIKFFRR